MGWSKIMPVAFPPLSLYPLALDTNRTLYLVYNTTETITTTDNDAWSEEIAIKPVAADKLEIWADNGFATIEGELLYYDSVDKNANGKVYKLKNCCRNIGGRATQFNAAGTWIRSFVIAEHHTQIVNAIINVETFVGENFSPDPVTLDWRIRHLFAEPLIFDDFSCPDVEFDFNIISTDANGSQTAQFAVIANGLTGSSEIQFGDGQSTTVLSGTHVYSPNATIDPVLIVTNDNCQIVQTPLSRTEITQPTFEAPTPPFTVPIPIPPAIPPFNFPSQAIPTIDINIPPIIFPSIGLAPSISIQIPSIQFPSFIINFAVNIPSLINFGPVNIPSVINFGPLNIPSVINFGPAPSFAPIGFGPIPSFPVIGFGPSPSFAPIEFGPVPTISFGPLPLISFAPLPLISFVGPVPSFPPVTFGPVPTFAPIDFAPTPSFSPIGFGPLPPGFGPIGFGPLPVGFGPIGFGPLPPNFGPIGFGPAPAISPVGFAPTPSFGNVCFCPVPSFSPICFAPVPSFPLIGFATFPSIAPIGFATPSFAPIDFGTPPLISVVWGQPPSITCTCQVTCPTSSPIVGARPEVFPQPGGFTAPDPGFENIELQYDMVGFPSEIKIVAPDIPPVELKHDIPEFISLLVPEFKDIRIIGPEIPIPHEIKIIAPEIGTIISLEMPSSIKLDFDSQSLPAAIPLVFPDKMPIISFAIPENIKVVGIPEVIRIDHPVPSVIKMEIPEGLKVPLVFEGPPISAAVKIDWGFGDKVFEGEEEIQRFAIIPMPCPK